ncbi:DUF2125 domain-containing protein [Fodinicurvata sp. EGI_FJ10296]|uniref:DUF2125 domain-containing protein n=1 Tax=Fodinicurvata sp. EGI_FJ10296 TaxID=3231908 RepID=UPI0034516B72
MQRFLIAVVALIAVLGAAYTGAWYYVASMARSGLETVVADQSRFGVSASYDNFQRSGFPSSLRIDADNPSVEGPNGIRWEGDAIAVEARNWWRRNVDVHLIGGHSLTIPEDYPLVATTESGRASFHVSWTGDVPSASAVLQNVEVETDQLPAPYNFSDVSTDQLAILGELIDQNTDGIEDLHLQLDATQIGLTSSPFGELGNSIERAGITGMVSGPLPRRRWSADDIVAWRDAGGQVRIDRAHLIWGPVTIEADGDLTLDAALQPRGRINVRVEGYEVLLDMMEERGVLEGRQATMARVGLQMMAGPPNEDGRSVLEAPITIQDRRVQIGPVQIATLPEIEWPGL